MAIFHINGEEIAGQVTGFNFTEARPRERAEEGDPPSLTIAQANRLNRILDIALDGRLKRLDRLDVSNNKAAAAYINLSVNGFNQAALSLYQAAGRNLSRRSGGGTGAWRADLFSLFVELGDKRPLALAQAVSLYSNRLTDAWRNKRLSIRLQIDGSKLVNLSRAAALIREEISRDMQAFAKNGGSES